MSEEGPSSNARRDFLRRRNACWQQLRNFEPDDPAFETVALELQSLTRLTRAQVLAGLGYAAEPAVERHEAS